MEVSRAASSVSGGDRRRGAQDPGEELCLRLVGQSSETTADAIEKLRSFVVIIQWAKCGESLISVIPTILWAIGAAALAQRLLGALFRRFLFRRIPLWEIILQNLLFMWMVIYSLHFWTILVKIVKLLVEYCYYDDQRSTVAEEDMRSEKMMQQWLVWMCGVLPLVVYIQTRPRPQSQPLMIWITTSPWQRREMGPYGYYLQRPPVSLQSSTNLTIRQQAFTVRRAFSDSKVVIKEPVKKKRYSKSV